MKLYEIDAQLERLLMLPDGAVDQETGEVFSAEALNELQMEWDKKVEGCLLWNKNQRAMSKALRDEAANLLARADKIDKEIERSDNYIIGILGDKLDGKKPFATDKVKASISTSTSCPEVIDIDRLPYKYIKYSEAKVVVTPAGKKVDKSALLKDLRKLKKDGETPIIAGVELQIKSKLKYE